MLQMCITAQPLAAIHNKNIETTEIAEDLDKPYEAVAARAGVFFIRRSFRGRKLYPHLVAAYLRKVLAEGFNVEFFMEGVALNEELMQDDGIHPNAAAQPRLLDNAWPIIVEALAQ